MLRHSRLAALESDKLAGLRGEGVPLSWEGRGNESTTAWPLVSIERETGKGDILCGRLEEKPVSTS